MSKTGKIFDSLFRPYVYNLVHYITIFSQTIILFFAGFIYGDAPIDLQFTYDIPSAVYEYEAGDIIKIHASAENVGRPFKMDVHSERVLMVSIYKIENDVKVYANASTDTEHTDEYSTGYFVEKGEIFEKDFYFKVREDAPTGAYTIEISSDFGDKEIFENAITIK